MEDNGRQGSTQLTSALPESLGLWCCGDGSLWRVETLLYENREYNLPDGLTGESTADWCENQNGNKVWDELIYSFKSLYSQRICPSGSYSSMEWWGRDCCLIVSLQSEKWTGLLLNGFPRPRKNYINSWDKSFPTKGLPSLSLLNRNERNEAK